MEYQHTMWDDIIDNHSQRMENIKRYYPFFRLCENAFTQYRDGIYSDLDMGYLILALLRFLIDENNFNERSVTCSDIEPFFSRILKRDFDLDLPRDQENELIHYIFDKIKNDGRPFFFDYFDPKEKKKKNARVKLIDSRIRDGNVYYSITGDGVAFYLDTREAKEDSSISVQQLLLTKMIESRNFAGGIDVVRRMNSEVMRLAARRDQVIRLLEQDPAAGASAEQEYMENVASWFDEEQQLFTRNKELVSKALDRIRKDDGDKKTGEYAEILSDIQRLEQELSRTTKRHAKLVADSMELTKITDEYVSRAKFRRLRPVFDFEEQLRLMKERDDVRGLELVVKPLLRPYIRKTFDLARVDEILSLRDPAEQKDDPVKEAEAEDYQYPDDLEQSRIEDNFTKFSLEMLAQIKKKHTVTLRELLGIYEIRFGDEVLENGDLYSFLVHLCQRSDYDMDKVLKKPDTFLDQIMADHLDRDSREKFEGLTFTLHIDPADEVKITDHTAVSNVTFERTDI